MVGSLGTDAKDDDMSDQYHYFSYNDTTIITLIEIPRNDGNSSMP